jgi:NAD(P)-dependent dehydrogenase (short-subunit alcohol dehydrogenase family)
VIEGQPVIITGAGRGLGRAYALGLAARGALIAVNDIDGSAESVRDEVRAAGGTAIAIVSSVSDWDAAAALVEQTIADFGRLHGLVANAGVFHVGPALEETPEQMRRSVETNLLGTLFTGIAALRYLVPAGAGTVITTTSGSATGLAGVSTYSATKGAIMSLTYSWAAELAGTGVRVNCVRPRAFTRMSAARGVRPEESPAPELVTPVIEFLLDDRSADLNGCVLGFDGHTLQLVVPAASIDLGTRTDWTPESISGAVATRPRS